MWLREGLTISPKHHLMIGGCDTVTLAREFGTPLYILDEHHLRTMCRAFVGAMRTFAPDGAVYYASKAFLCTAMCKIVMQEGMGLDVVSGGELYTALQAGFPMARVTLHGNCKTPREVHMALENDVGHIVIDGRSEIPMIQAIAAELGKTACVQVRLNPDISVDTHKSIQTATNDCKFGLSVGSGEALMAVKEIAASKNLRLTGVHIHLGSQIFDLQSYVTAIDRLTDFMLLSAVATGTQMTDLVLGGGFGVKYTEKDRSTTNPWETIKMLARETERQAKRKGLPVPKLVLEPGRIIVAEAGLTLYTVGGIKTIPDVRTYVAVDGGMMDNPRVALYQGKYEALLANRADEPATGVYALAGRACESGDVLGYDFKLPTPQLGDLVAMTTTGAYHYSMASNYNRVPVPAMVLVSAGRAELIVARQRYEDVAQYDRMPAWL